MTKTLQSAATSGNGSAGSIEDRGTVYVKGAGTISGGAVVVEEADSEDYSGTWSTIATITASALTGGAAQAVHLDGTYRAIRARVSSSITGGGSITAELVGFSDA